MQKLGVNYLIHCRIGFVLMLALWPMTGFAADFLLQWNPNSASDQVTGYYVYYREGSSMAGDPANADQKVDIPLYTEDFAPAHPSYILTNLIDDTLYYFAVSAYNSAGESDLSEEVFLSKSSNDDLQPPVVTAPGNIALTAPDVTGVPASDPAIAAFLNGATAVDDVDGDIATITNDAPDPFPIGATTVTFSAMDSSGNTGTAQATATVSAPLDITAPVLSNGRPSGTFDAGTTQIVMQVATDEPATCHWSQTADTDYADMAGTFTADAGGTGHSATIDGLSDGASYQYHVRCTDAVGNANTTDYTVSWAVADTSPQDDQAPVVTAPDDMQITAADDTGMSASDPAIASFLAGATATDDMDGPIGAITNDAPAHFPMGTTTVTFNATDTAGNTGSAQATVTVLSPNDSQNTDTSAGSGDSDGGSGSGSSGCFIGSLALQP